ncbi:MAG: hypothetical protein AB199_03940 [Parcubacteria bacterium C7867-004]|nr:MAG: hypothetical protein AB199_03940 [Parcubacteria bacterium C7867-004]
MDDGKEPRGPQRSHIDSAELLLDTVEAARARLRRERDGQGELEEAARICLGSKDDLDAKVIQGGGYGSPGSF